MPAITISRQYGSGDREIADRVCELLGYAFFDKWLIAQVAAEVGLSKDEIVDFSEEHYKVKNFLTRASELFSLRSRRVADVPVLAHGHGEAPTLNVTQMDENAAVELVNTTIQAAYNQGYVVIIGRGGQAVLKDKPDVLHVRLEAPMDARIVQVREQENLSAQAARQLIDERDRAAAEYLARYHRVRWDDPLLYHLVINTARMRPEGASQLIVTALLQM